MGNSSRASVTALGHAGHNAANLAGFEQFNLQQDVPWYGQTGDIEEGRSTDEGSVPASDALDAELSRKRALESGAPPHHQPQSTEYDDNPVATHVSSGTSHAEGDHND